MSAPRILLVGATGRVGRLLVGNWRIAPPRHAHLVYQSRHQTDFPMLLWSPENGSTALQADADRHGPYAAMIMLAGATPATGADMNVNVTIAEECLRAATETGIPRVLLASSSAVYGASSGTPFTETDPVAPQSDYARSKLAMEQVAATFRTPALDICALRIGNVAGADALMLNAAKATPDAPVRIDRFADGTGPQRNYIGPATMARVLEHLSLTPATLPPILNLAAPRPVMMEALAQAADIPWQFTAAPDSAIHRVTLDCAQLAALYPFTAQDSDPIEMIRQARAAA